MKRRPDGSTRRLHGRCWASCGFAPAAGQGVQVAAGLALCAVTSRVLISRRPLRDRVSEPVACIVLAAAAGNLGLIPNAHGVYDVVGGQLLPLACSLFLFGADVKRVQGLRTTAVAFLIGALGTVLGVLVASAALAGSVTVWPLAGLFSATYVGGTVNYLAVAEALGIRSWQPELLAAGLVVDNVLMAAYLSLLFVLSPSRGRPVASVKPHFDAPKLLKAALLALGISTSCKWLCSMLHLPAATAQTPLLAVTTALCATVLPNTFAPLAGAASMLAQAIFSVFFATIGASAHLPTALRQTPWTILFAALVLAVHGLVVWVVGKRLLRIPTPELLVASNANVGGAGSASAFASERSWAHLVLPAVVVGSLGYIIATPLGVAIGAYLRSK